MKKNSLHNEIEPGFPKIETGYSVPEGFFENFGDRLNARLEAQPQVSTSRGLLIYLRPAIGIAAGIALIVAIYVIPSAKKPLSGMAQMQHVTVITSDDQQEQLSNTYASLITDGQFFSALDEMDDYDASKMPKDELADYLASNCSDFEILNASK